MQLKSSTHLRGSNQRHDGRGRGRYTATVAKPRSTLPGSSGARGERQVRHHQQERLANDAEEGGRILGERGMKGKVAVRFVELLVEIPEFVFFFFLSLSVFWAPAAETVLMLRNSEPERTDAYKSICLL